MNDINPLGKRVNPEDYFKIGPEYEQKICELVQANKVTEAIELYCIKMDCGIAEAQDKVQKIAGKQNLNIHKETKIGCVTVILILVSLITLCLFIVMLLADKFHF